MKEVTTTLGASMKCSAEVHRLEGLGDALDIQRSKEELKTAKKAYFRAVRLQKQKVHDQSSREEASTDGCSW